MMHATILSVSKPNNLQQLISDLQEMVEHAKACSRSASADVVHVLGADGGPVELTLVEHQLGDCSTVYDIRVGRAR